MKIKVFGKPGCEKCKYAQRRLKEEKIPFDYFDLTTTAGLAEGAYYEILDSNLPVILSVDDQGEVLDRHRSVLQAIKALTGKDLLQQGESLQLDLGF
jgi:glutaredoxin